VTALLMFVKGKDVKGLYKKVRDGEIKYFISISSPYETPENAELIVDTGNYSIEECVSQVYRLPESRNVLNSLE